MRSMQDPAPFNRPHLTGRELSNIAEAHINGQLSGDGPFTKLCEHWLEKLGAQRALLTHSCTAALEMAAILCKVGPGDEVIMPSYTFVSTANAFVLRGAVPVFVDIRADTLNIDETKIEAAITPRTKVIVPVHYAGVGCEMDTIMDIAKRHRLLVVEDAAQACLSTYKGRQLGTIGDLGCFSFHETKNIVCGEGGALLVNRAELVGRAEIIREKGTNRSSFVSGKVDKYTWMDIGSSFLPGELTAAFLWAQMAEAECITARRRELWNNYYSLFVNKAPEHALPKIPPHCKHNAHMFYLLSWSQRKRSEILKHVEDNGITAVSHYVPLHLSKYWSGRTPSVSRLPVTETQAEKIFRVPLFLGLDTSMQMRVVECVLEAMTQFGASKKAARNMMTSSPVGIKRQATELSPPNVRSGFAF